MPRGCGVRGGLVPYLRRCGPDGHTFAGSSEDAEDLRGFLASAAEPVRHVGVERGDLTRPEHPVLVAENETNVPGQNVDPARDSVRRLARSE